MTENQINEKALETYPEKHVQMPFCMNTNDINEDHREGYKKALNDIESLPKIKGWVARDENNLLCVYTSRPHYNQNLHIWENSEDWFEIDENYFPEAQYYNEPIEIELLIRKV